MSKFLEDGDNPALGYCRICGTLAVPPYPGYYRDSICSAECFDEWTWRETLHIVRKPYRRRQIAATSPL
jgi:hypothetical protein